jgi:HNH endonuclease
VGGLGRAPSVVTGQALFPHFMEAEAAAVRFTIDHYEPTSARPDLENEYNNLMYACDPCNTRKGDRYPPLAARAEGVRFFRPDEDVHSDHFELTGVRLKGKSKTGEYTVVALDLNRYMLNKLRERDCCRQLCHGRDRSTSSIPLGPSSSDTERKSARFPASRARVP